MTRRAPNLLEYLETRCTKFESCLLCTNKPNTYGYVQIARNNHLARDYGESLLHRIVWTHYNGKIPKDKIIMHKCDVRNCVAIEHLQLGTCKENILDCISKGRRNIVYGEQVVGSILKVKHVKIIRELQGEYSGKFVAEFFSVGVRTIYDIWQNKTWRSV